MSKWIEKMGCIILSMNRIVVNIFFESKLIREETAYFTWAGSRLRLQGSPRYAPTGSLHTVQYDGPERYYLML